MMRELLIELQFPEFLIARYGDDVVKVPLRELENNFLFELLPRLDEFSAQERERFLVYLGQELFELLFPAGVLELYLRAQAEQRRTPLATLRIRILSNSTPLLTHPWEFLYDSRQAVFPATVPETPILRTPRAVLPGQALTPQHPIRLLLVGASPTDEPILNYHEEMQSIEALARDAGLTVETLPHATAKLLQTRLETLKPHVVHFMCHGYVHADGAGLKLEDRRQQTHLVGGEQLCRLLSPAQPRLVVLNACYSAQMLRTQERNVLALVLLSAGIPAVVAMQHRVPDQAALVFGQSLFSALLQGVPLERAFQAGRHALLVAGGLLERHFTTPTLYLATQEGGRLVEAATDPHDVARPGNTRSPFLYLSSFSQKDSALFFGRSKAIEALVSRVATHRMLVIHGKSGVGKSSLLQAGVVQSSAARLYLLISIRFIAEPLRALTEALERTLQTLPAQDDGAAPPAPPQRSALGGDLHTEAVDISALIRRLQALSKRTILLVLDQFEELFILLSEEERARFLEVLHSLYMDSSLRLRIVLVIREDFLGELDRLRDIFPTILSNSYLLAALTHAEAREALVGPLDSVGVSYETEWIDAVIEDLGHTGIEPASLQIVGHHVYDRCFREQQAPLTRQAYQEMGRASGILGQYLLTFLGQFSVGEQTMLIETLKQFITEQGTRQPSSVAHIAEQTRLPPLQVRELLGHLSTAHLVRRLDATAGTAAGPGGGDTAAQWELSHEVLISAIEESQLINIRQAMERKQRRLYLQFALLVMSVLLVLVTLIFLNAHGVILTITAPGQGEWALHLETGMVNCVKTSSHQEHTVQFSGTKTYLPVLPVGSYEATLTRGEDLPLRFSVLVTPFGLDHVTFEPVTENPPPLLSNGDSQDWVQIPSGVGPLGVENLSRVGYALTPVFQDLGVFFVTRTEVTIGQYREFVAQKEGGTPHAFQCVEVPPDLTPMQLQELYQTLNWYHLINEECKLPEETALRLAVANITYEEIHEYTTWLNLNNPGYRFALPSEEQWERAARGMDGRLFPWGNCRSDGSQANLSNNDPSVADIYVLRAPVGSFPPGASPYGVLDMTGNVLELTSSTYDQELRRTQPEGKYKYVGVRGGSLKTPRVEALATTLGHIDPGTRAPNLGFRIVATRINGDMEPSTYPQTPPPTLEAVPTKSKAGGN